MLAEQLEKMTASLNWVEVHQVTLAATAGEFQWYRYNLRDAGGLHKATGLVRLFPGLKELSVESVEALQVSDFLRTLHLDSQQTLELVIELAGEEFGVLQSMLGTGELQLFERISISCGHLPLYECSETADSISLWMSQHGFELEGVSDSGDPDFPRFCFRRNTLMLENLTLRQDVESLLLARAELENEAKAREQSFLRLRREQDANVEEFNSQKAQLENLSRALEARNQDVDGLRKNIERLAEDEEEKVGLIKELREEVDRFKLRCVEQDDRNNALLSQIDQLTLSRDDLASRLAETRRELAEVVSERDRQTVQIDEFQSELIRLESLREKLLEEISDAVEQAEESKQAASAKDQEIAQLEGQIDGLTEQLSGQIEATREVSERLAINKSEKADAEMRKNLLDQEMIRAEAQIELIKEMILKDLVHPKIDRWSSK